MLKLFRTLLAGTSSPSPSASLLIAKCSTSSPSLLNSHIRADSNNVQVSVWWDADNCPVPPGVDVFSVAEAIKAAIKASGIKGPVKIYGFGDLLMLSETNQWAITRTGIRFKSVAQGGNYSTEALSRELNRWVNENPPPGHVLLISNNANFAELLHHIRNKHYNVLIASKGCSLLSSCATMMWSWDALVREKNLTRRYFNQPPSWYDHYEGLLEDPSTTTIERPVIQHMCWCNDEFWTHMKILINSEIGAFILSEAGSRDNMAYYLKLYGPKVLRDVPKSDVLLMIEIMISQKKLVEEIAQNEKPFRSKEEAEKRYEHARKMEKEIIRVNKLLKNHDEEEKADNKKIDELNAIKENLQKINEELKSQIPKPSKA